jgi:putative heme-binding domain-containing protein
MSRVLPLAAMLLLFQEDVAKQLSVVLDIKASLPDREAAVKNLGKTKPGGLALLDLASRNVLPAELRATASFAVAACADPDVRAKGEQLLPRPKSKDGKPLPPLSELVEMKGDAKAGGLVFRNNNGGANCIGCHQIGDEGRQVGPPLTTIATKLSREQLFESVLTPSAAILMSYELWIVRTKDGDIKTGIKAEENDDHITLKDNNGDYIDIPIGKIAEKKQSALSMMPDDITKTLSIQDLVDVVEYLSLQK